MKKLALLVSAAAIIGCGGNQPDANSMGGTNFTAQPGKSPAETAAKAYLSKGSGAAAIESSNSQGIKLFVEAAKSGNDNVLISPLAAGYVSALMTNAAHGETRTLMLRSLGLAKLRPDDVNQAYRMLSEQLSKEQAGLSAALSGAIWTKPDLKLENEFVRIAKNGYGVAINDMASTSKESLANIAKWLRERTANGLKAAISEEELDVPALIAAALEVKGKWQLPFDASQTKAASFGEGEGAPTANMMLSTGTFGYLKSDEAEIVRLPYLGGSAAAYVIVPSGKLDELIARLTPAIWTKWMADIKPQFGAVSIPKTTIASMQTLSIGDGSAEFAAMAKSKPQIKSARIAASLQLEEGPVPDQPNSQPAEGQTQAGFKVSADKPFIVAIVQDDTKAIILLAAVRKP